jgi:hypothetical protein
MALDVSDGGSWKEDAELLDSRTLGKLSSYIDLPTRLG